MSSVTPAATAPNLLPVPGAEHLRWVGSPLRLVGPRPPESRNTFGGVTPSGVRWLICVDRAPPRDRPMPLHVDVWRGLPGELRACGSFVCPAGHYPERVLGRAGGA